MQPSDWPASQEGIKLDTFGLTQSILPPDLSEHVLCHHPVFNYTVLYRDSSGHGTMHFHHARILKISNCTLFNFGTYEN